MYITSAQLCQSINRLTEMVLGLKCLEIDIVYMIYVEDIVMQYCNTKEDGFPPKQTCTIH